MAYKIAIAADPYGFSLKNYIKKDLEKKGHVFLDFSPDEPMEYSMAAHKVAEAVQRKEVDRGIAICGTGMGVSIVCNKHRGVYACLCENLWQAVRAKAVNNTNVLCLGGMITGEYYGAQIANAWIDAEHLVGLDPEMAEIVKGEFARIPAMEEKLYKNNGKPEEK